MEIYVEETELMTHAFVLKTDNRTSKKGQHMCPLEASTYEPSTHRIGLSNIMSLLFIHNNTAVFVRLGIHEIMFLKCSIYSHSLSHICNANVDSCGL